MAEEILSRRMINGGTFLFHASCFLTGCRILAL
jgi:hypothetical protein